MLPAGSLVPKLPLLGGEPEHGVAGSREFWGTVPPRWVYPGPQPTGCLIFLGSSRAAEFNKGDGKQGGVYGSHWRGAPCLFWTFGGSGRVFQIEWAETFRAAPL